MARSPFKASATVIVGSFLSIEGFRIEDTGDGNPTVVLTRRTSDGHRVIVGPTEALRKFGSAILAAYRGYGGEQPITAPVPLPTKPPTISRRAARPLPEPPTT